MSPVTLATYNFVTQRRLHFSLKLKHDLSFPVLLNSVLGIRGEKKDIGILSLHVSNSVLDLINSCLME